MLLRRAVLLALAPGPWPLYGGGASRRRAHRDTPAQRMHACVAGSAHQPRSQQNDGWGSCVDGVTTARRQQAHTRQSVRHETRRMMSMLI